MCLKSTTPSKPKAVLCADRLEYLHQSDLVWTHLARRDSMDDHVIAPVERSIEHGDRKE